MKSSQLRSSPVCSGIDIRHAGVGTVEAAGSPLAARSASMHSGLSLPSPIAQPRQPTHAVLAALPATRAADCGPAHAGVGTLRTLRQPVPGAAARRAMQGDCSPIGACGPVLSRKSFSYNRIRCVQVAFADKPRVVRPL